MKKLKLTLDEVNMLCHQLSYRCAELDAHLKEQISQGKNFDDTY